MLQKKTESPRRRVFSFSPGKKWGWHTVVDFVPPPPAHQKTLILDLDETLIHSSSFPPHSLVDAFKSGDPPFYVYKRPGLDNFLEFVTSKFDTFIYTYGEEEYANPVLDQLCPFIDKDHRLFRDSCDIEGNMVHKNLDIFQRPEKDLILVDDNESVSTFHPENTIMIPKWQGTPHDQALIKWLPDILERCLEAPDVRKVIATVPKIKRRKSECLI